MKRIIIGVLTLTTVATMSMANDDFYVGIGTAMEMVDNELIDDTGTALEVKVGKKFNNNFGIEGKITKTIILAEDVTLKENRGTTKADDSGIVFGIDIKKSFPNLGFDIYAGLYTVETDVTHLSFGIEKNF